MENQNIFSAALFNATSHNRILLVAEFLATDLGNDARYHAQQQIDLLASQTTTDKSTLEVLAVVIQLPDATLAANDVELLDEKQSAQFQKNTRAKRLIRLANAINLIGKDILLTVDGMVVIEAPTTTEEQSDNEPS